VLIDRAEETLRAEGLRRAKAVFEAPFLRHRGMRALREIPGVQMILRGRGASTVPPTDVAMARGHGSD